MPRLTAHDFHPEILRLFDQYVHGGISRRGFLEGASRHATAGMTAAEAARIKSPLLIQYAANDERINAGWPAYEAALKAAGVRYEAFVYPGTQHGFNNDTTPRYDEAAAKLAWQRTIAFFKKTLA